MEKNNIKCNLCKGYWKIYRYELYDYIFYGFQKDTVICPHCQDLLFAWLAQKRRYLVISKKMKHNFEKITMEREND